MNYLTKNKYLIKKMAEWGFERKSKNVFRRIEKDAILDFYFSHYTNGEIHVKYYTININVWYPEIDRIKETGGFHFGIPNCSIWNDLGHLMRFPIQKGFRVSDADDGAAIQKTINVICDLIKAYALPLMEKYSSPKVYIADYEDGMLDILQPNKQTMALLYLIYEGKDKALKYAKEQLDQYKENEPKEQAMTMKEGKIAGMNSVTISVSGNELVLWEDLYEKIKVFH